MGSGRGVQIALVALVCSLVVAVAQDETLSSGLQIVEDDLLILERGMTAGPRVKRTTVLTDFSVASE